MPFGFGLSAGLRALTAARLGIQTAGNNVANANTPGYTRQRVDLVTAFPFTTNRGMQIGAGVDVADITRLVDNGLQRRIRLQTGLFGAAEANHSRFQELEGIFNEPAGGLSSVFSDFFGAIGSLKTDPADRALRGGVIQHGKSLADGLRLMSDRFGRLQGSTFTEVDGLVRQVNQHARAIAELNAQIMGVEAGGASANDLRDRREQHIVEISRLMETNAIERSTGSVDLLVGGSLLVSGNRAVELATDRSTANRTEVVLAGQESGSPVRITGGRIGALLAQEESQIPALQARLDELAFNMILEFNRLQTTGVPRGGPHHSLTSFYQAQDGDGDGQRGDELLSQAGFPFAVQRGDLYVSVTDEATGALERTRIAIDPAAMTLEGFAAALDGIDHLNASVDGTGRLRITAEAGFGFDFSPQLDPAPDSFGSFGGAAPAIGTPAGGPFDLGAAGLPATFTVTTGTAASPTVTTVTIDPSDFQNPAAATAEELAAAINADLGPDASAAVVGGRLVIRSESPGANSQLTLADTAGTVVASLGMTTATVSGQDQAVTVSVQGSYTGSANDQLVFVPNMDGEIGVTPGLEIEVFDSLGNRLGSVAAGAGYTPGDPLNVRDGVSVSFGPGSVASSSGDVFALDVLADSDTTDVLVALGLNSFFHGSSASDIEMNPDLLANANLLAAGTSKASGDTGNLDRFLALRTSGLTALDGNSLEDYYGDIVGDLGFETAAAELTLQSQDALLQSLQDERERISGVNLDEEMVNLMQFQQAFDAAARYISTVQELSETVINLAR